VLRVRRVSPSFSVLLALALGAVLAASGCKKSGSPRLEGHWRGSKAEGVTSDVQAAANTFALDTELDVKGEAISVRTPKGKQSGKFKVVREDKKSVVIITDADGPKDEQTFTFDDERTMRWKVVEGKTISFHRE
jgi:hypothetical protein